MQNMQNMQTGRHLLPGISSLFLQNFFLLQVKEYAPAYECWLLYAAYTETLEMLWIPPLTYRGGKQDGRGEEGGRKEEERGVGMEEGGVEWNRKVERKVEGGGRSRMQ